MLGLLNSRVDPPNSPLGVAHCLLSEGQWIRTPCTRGTQLTGHSSGAPTQLSANCACQIYHSLWILYFGLVRAKSWFWHSEWQAALPNGNSNWTIPYSWTDLNSGTVHGVPTRYWGRQRYPIQISHGSLSWSNTARCASAAVLESAATC